MGMVYLVSNLWSSILGAGGSSQKCTNPVGAPPIRYGAAERGSVFISTGAARVEVSFAAGIKDPK